MKFVAVTSCPTGIAHSQMAAENLEQTASGAGHEIRVEVQGAMGAEDELTAEEIADADAVIIAADTSVQRDRFEGKPVVKGTVKDAVNDAEGLIDQAIAKAGGDAAGAGASADADSGADAGGDADLETDEVTAADPTTAAVDDESTGTADDARTADDAGRQRRGGDPSKGLFARLKRLFS